MARATGICLIKPPNYRIMRDHIEETVMTELVLQENGLSLAEISAQLGAQFWSRDCALIGRADLSGKPPVA